MFNLWGWRLEPQPDPPRWLVFAVSVGAVVAALLVTGLIFWAYGHNPVTAYRDIFASTLGNPRGFSEVLRKSVPLLLAGVGLVLAFRAQFWNIGAEGQILAGAVAASGVALFVPLGAPWLIVAMFVAGFLGGALWGMLPALLKVRLGVSEIITTLMLNYVAIYGVQYLIYGPWKGLTTRGMPISDTFVAAAWLPTLAGTRLHWPTLLLGVLLAVAVHRLLGRTTLGFETKVLGQSPKAARYAGINVGRTTALLVLVAAGAAGLAGVGEVAGIHHRLVEPTQLSLGYGYTAIIVALLARGNPLAVILSALLLGWVSATGDVVRVTLRLPAEITGVISGLILFFLISSEPLLRYRWRREPQRQTPARAPGDAPVNEGSD